MSYDIYLRSAPCPTCHHSQGSNSDLPNPTYNLTPIFDFALTGEAVMPNADVPEGRVVVLGAPTDRPRGLRVLSGMRAGDTVTLLKVAIDRFRDPTLHEQFLALEPSNGWGTLAGAIAVIGTLYAAAVDLPEAIWEIR